MIRIYTVFLFFLTLSLSAMQRMQKIYHIPQKIQRRAYYTSWGNSRNRLLNHHDKQTGCHEILDYIPYHHASGMQMQREEYKKHLREKIDECRCAKRVSLKLSCGSFVSGVSSYMIGAYDIIPEVNLAAVCIGVASIIIFPGSLVTYADAADDEHRIKGKLHETQMFRKSLEKDAKSI